MRCLDTWRAQDPTEIIVVLDVADTEALRAHHRARRPAGHARPVQARRQALGARRRASALATVRAPGAHRLRHLVGAGPARRTCRCRSSNPQVGAVEHPAERLPARHQRVAADRRLAGQPALLRLRAGDGPRRRGGLRVRPHRARTAARVVMPVLENLENEFFLGRRCVAGDDGRLTWLVLGLGLQDGPPVLRPGAVDVPRHASARSSSSACGGAATPTAATSPRSARAGCGGCRSSPRSPSCRSCSPR